MQAIPELQETQAILAEMGTTEIPVIVAAPHF
jgi:hypothetical protein